MSAPALPVASLPASGRLRLAEKRLVMLIGTLEFVVSHCDDAPMAAALDLLAIGLEELQKAVEEYSNCERAGDGLQRLQRLLCTLLDAFAHFDRESVDWPSLCGVIGLVNMEMSAMYDDVVSWLDAREPAGALSGAAALGDA